MNFILNGTLLTFIALISGSAIAGEYSPKVKSITYDEASEFENSLQFDEAPVPQMEEALYTQPVNKKTPCKLPTSADQLERNNFRAYWDGQCKNGYAYGLGRDIAISDTHHVEEITIHSGKWDNINAPSVYYDFVNNEVQYSMTGGKFPEASYFEESIQNGFHEFNVVYTATMIDKTGRSLKAQGSLFNPERIFTNDNNKIVYKFTDNTAMPVVNPSAANFLAETLGSITGTVGGVSIVGYGNGQFRHLKLSGNQSEDVILPIEYLSNLQEKYKALLQVQARVNADVERARQIEREYLYMACNGKHIINGLSKKISTLICSWRDQFKEPYQEALVKYTEHLKQMKQIAETSEQQRKVQVQMAETSEQQRQVQAQIKLQEENIRQQAALQEESKRQQESKQAVLDSLNAIGNSFGQLGQQMQKSNQQMQQNFMNLPPINFGIPSEKKINCMTIGSNTSCRYRP